MCFELTVSLMRALEMIISIAPVIFVDPSRANSDLLLSRICQLISQVLSRVTVPPGCFQHVVDLCLPDLSTITHFAIISAAVGILLALLKDELNRGIPFTFSHSLTKRSSIFMSLISVEDARGFCRQGSNKMSWLTFI